jgi:hypothetical protein
MEKVEQRSRRAGSTVATEDAEAVKDIQAFRDLLESRIVKI